MHVSYQRKRMWPNYQTCSSSNASSSEQPTFPYSQPTSPFIPSAPPPPAHHQCAATLKAQNSYTSSLALAGKFLFTGSSDKEIRIFNLNSANQNDNDGDMVMVVAGKGAVKALLVSADKLISAHQDHKIRVWQIDNHDRKITHVATLPTLGDRAIRLLIPKNHIQVRRHKTQTWIHHVDTVSSLALSTDASLLYSVSWDRTIKIWRTTDFQCLESVANAHDDAINAIAVSTDGFAYTGSSDKKIKVWKKKTGEKKHSLVDTLEKHNSGVNALVLSVDGTVLYSGGSDRLILVWMNDGGGGGGMVLVGALRGHTKSVLCLGIVSDLVCSGSADKTVRIWRSHSCLAVVEGHKGPIKCIALAFDDHNSDALPSSAYLLYTASLDCDIKIWKILIPIF